MSLLPTLVTSVPSSSDRPNFFAPLRLCGKKQRAANLAALSLLSFVKL